MRRKPQLVGILGKNGKLMLHGIILIDHTKLFKNTGPRRREGSG
jgi:hypothetical protein